MWYSGLSCHFKCLPLLSVLASSFRMQPLGKCILGGRQQWHKCIGLCNSWWRSGMSSSLLRLALLTPAYCGHLRNEPANRTLFLSLCFSKYFLFYNFASLKTMLHFQADGINSHFMKKMKCSRYIKVLRFMRHKLFYSFLKLIFYVAFLKK